jgi:hypothetical protein
MQQSFTQYLGAHISVRSLLKSFFLLTMIIFSKDFNHEDQL